jgi:hypothetical protein
MKDWIVAGVVVLALWLAGLAAQQKPQKPTLKFSENALVVQSKVWLSWPCDDLKHCNDKVPSRVIFEAGYPDRSLICALVDNVETCKTFKDFKDWASGHK